MVYFFCAIDFSVILVRGTVSRSIFLSCNMFSNRFPLQTFLTMQNNENSIYPKYILYSYNWLYCDFNMNEKKKFGFSPLRSCFISNKSGENTNYHFINQFTNQSQQLFNHNLHFRFIFYFKLLQSVCTFNCILCLVCFFRIHFSLRKNFD